MVHFTFVQIKAFNAVARDGSITAAADRLGVSQPAVTAQIRAVEKNYGVMLFHRSPTGMSLTETGRRLYRETEALDDQEQAIERVLSDSHDLTTGELRIVSGAPQPCMRLVSAFRERYPQVAIDVSFGNWGEVVDAIAERRADAAVLTGGPEDDSMESLALAPQRLVALVPVHQEIHLAESLSLQELSSQPVIFRSGHSLTQRLIDQKLEDLGLSLTPAMRLGTREAVYEAVAAGVGIGFMLEAASSRLDGVRRLPIRELPDPYPEVVFCLRQHYRRRVIRAFFDSARELPTAEA